MNVLRFGRRFTYCGRSAVGHVALQFADGVRHGGPDGFEILHGSGGAAGKIQNQGALANSADGAGEHGVWSFAEAGGAHGFAEAGDDAVENLQRRLRRNVARRDAGAAGGQNQIRIAGVRPLRNGIGDEGLLVGNHRRGGDFDAALGEPVRQRRPALVDALATRAFVADGEDCRSRSDLSLRRFIMCRYSPGFVTVAALLLLFHPPWRRIGRFRLARLALE